MGVAAHAFLVRCNLSGFAHVHPAGSVSMAARELSQPDAGPVHGMMRGMMHASGVPVAVPGRCLFPYGFPEPGVYRLFVQVK